jgi:hypothetical protein
MNIIWRQTQKKPRKPNICLSAARPSSSKDPLLSVPFSRKVWPFREHQSPQIILPFRAHINNSGKALKALQMSGNSKYLYFQREEEKPDTASQL